MLNDNEAETSLKLS